MSVPGHAMDLLLLLMLLPGVPDQEPAPRPVEPPEREHEENEAPSGTYREPDEG